MGSPTPEQVSARNDAAKAEASDEVAAAKLRINEQSALMVTIDQLRTNKAAGQTDDIRKKKVYNNFCTFRPKKGGGGHISLTNLVYRPKSTKYLFDSIPPQILSSLLPSIKLYKVFIPEKDKEGRQSSGYSWAIPFDDVPFSYGADRNLADDKKINQNVETLLLGENRGNSIGIKSFRYKFVGTNPAEVNTNIEASLEIFFQDVRDLVKEITFKQDDPNFTEAPTTSRDFSFAYTDLAVDVSSSKNKGLEYNEQYFRLKAVIGYASPPPGYLESLISDPQELENAKRAIQSTKVILYLNPHNHDISFEENGTITLKIQYIAAMTSVLASLDALAISQEHEKLKKAQEDYDATSSQEKQEIDKIKNDCEPGKFASQKDKDEALKTAEGQARAKLFDQQNQLENLQISTYSDIFQRLIGAPPYDKNGGKIFAATYNEFALGVSSEGVGQADVLENPTQRRIQNIGSSMYTSYKVESITADDLKTLKLGNKPNNVQTPRKGFFGGGQPDPESNNTAAKKAQEGIEKAQPTGATDIGGGNYKIKFIFLGDLFDIFCECLKDIKNPSERPRIILSDFNIEIPVSSQIGNNPVDIYNTDAAYKSISVNIADIPISLNMLQNFFLEKMIKPRRSSYPLVSIINDIITDVVIPSVAPSVFGRKTVINKAIRLSTLNMSVPFVGNTDGIIGKDINDTFNGDLNEDSFIGKDVAGNGALFSNRNFGNYLVIYCSNQLPQDILKGNGDIPTDEANGIYHFFIGTDAGIIKKVSFSRTNTPFYKEAKAQSSSGDKSLGRLREVYDCKISMFGNNVYRPGDFIYIEPLFFTGNSAALLQNRLGLGGYYQIIDVETSINENVFETNLSAVLAGYKDENNKVVAANGKGPC